MVSWEYRVIEERSACHNSSHCIAHEVALSYTVLMANASLLASAVSCPYTRIHQLEVHVTEGRCIDHDSVHRVAQALSPGRLGRHDRLHLLQDGVPRVQLAAPALQHQRGHHDRADVTGHVDLRNSRHCAHQACTQVLMLTLPESTNSALHRTHWVTCWPKE